MFTIAADIYCEIFSFPYCSTVIIFNTFEACTKHAAIRLNKINKDNLYSSLVAQLHI